MLAVMAFLATACADRKNSDSHSDAQQSSAQTVKNMKNLVSIVEIPADSFQRAVRFYETILDIKIQDVDMQGTLMGLFPGEEGSVNLALVHGSGYAPSAQGTMAYLNGGDDLQTVLDKIEAAGGKIITPKTEIDPENGFFAAFTDTEGNKIGLHSFR